MLALREVTRLGFPLRGWWQHETLTGGSFYAVFRAARALDPTYAEDFWTVPGYEGADDKSPVARARVRHDTAVAAASDDLASALELSEIPAGYLAGADLLITSGASEGTSLTIGAVDGTTVQLAPGADPTVLRTIRPGDTVRIDNSFVLAVQCYFRHQVPSLDQYGWNQFRGEDGAPLPPQRTVLVGKVLAEAAGGSVATGSFDGKMILLASELDVQAFPWMADWYSNAATAAFGPELGTRFRLWLTANADHDAPPDKAAEAHVVGYGGTLQQALLDLDRWVTEDSSPPTTSYTISADTQVVLASSAAERQGIQPVVRLSADDRDHTKVTAGGRVDFDAIVEVPAGAGEIVAVEWDFEGTGDYSAGALVDTSSTVGLRATHTYLRPGTYFATVRVTSQRDGEPDAPYTRIQNLARVRVEVR